MNHYTMLEGLQVVLDSNVIAYGLSDVWKPSWGWLQFGGDVAIALGLVSIPLWFIYRFRQRPESIPLECLESNQKLALLVQQTPVAVIEWTLNFEVADWNPAAEKIFGYSKQEVLGCQGLELLVPETDKEEIHQLWQQLLQQQGGTRSTHENLTKDNKTIYCTWYNTPLIDAHEQVIGVASLVEDITERKLAREALQTTKTELEVRVEERTQELKRAIAQLRYEIAHRQKVEASLREREEQYRSVVDSVKEAIFQTDAHGLWTFLNPAWTEITGFAIAQSLGTLFLDYVHPDDRPHNLNQFRPLFEGKKEYCQYQVRYLTADGSYRWIEVLAQLTFDADGNMNGTCGTLNDITERYLNELARATSEAQLRKQHQALSDLAQCQSIYNGHLSSALQNITETVASTLEVERCSVWFYSDDRTWIECVDLYELTPHQHSSSYQFQTADYPSYFQALDSNQIIVADDAYNDARTREFSASYLTPLGITSMLDTPIRLGGVTVGVLCIEHTGSKRQWSWEEQNFASTTAYLASLAMEASHRAATEKALRQSEARFRSLVANIPGVVYRCAYDADWTREFISDGIEEMSGYPASDFLHNRVRTFGSLIVPQDRTRVQQILLECIAQRQPYVLEYRIIRKDGVVRWVYEKGQGVFAADGNLLWLDGVIFDITEGKRTQEELRLREEQFRQLTENIREVFFLTTPDLTQFLYISPAYEEVWGRTTVSLYEQPNSWLDSIHPKDRDRVTAAIAQYLQQQQNFQEEFRIVRPDRGVRWVCMRAFFVMNQAGVATRIAGLAEDITEHKRAQAEILNALLHEKELNDIKSRFVSLTSHEFRTPLTTIMSTTELLQYYEWTKEEELEQLELIENAAKQMLQLLEDVLFIGTADAGKVRFNPEPLVLNEFCQDLVTEIQRGVSLKPTTADSPHTLTFTGPNRVVLACMDKKLLRQLLSNLLLNAIKYSPDGGTVRFELACQGDKAIFQIQDEGIGIPIEDQSLVFEFFYRANNVNAIAGTGLGLAIVKKCVELHSGQIVVDSQVGQGTKFTITLPLNDPKSTTHLSL
ncbi:MAG TPA: PAS domain S-box protein [Cyanophyceae cyanobacterium]